MLVYAFCHYGVTMHIIEQSDKTSYNRLNISTYKYSTLTDFYIFSKTLWTKVLHIDSVPFAFPVLECTRYKMQNSSLLKKLITLNSNIFSQHINARQFRVRRAVTVIQTFLSALAKQYFKVFCKETHHP